MLFVRRLLLLAFAALIVACGSATPAQISTDDATPETSATQSEPTQPPTQPTPAEPLPRLRLQRVFPSLAFNQMTGLYQLPDDRWLVTEQPGRILVFDDRNDAQARVFLDIQDRVDSSSSEMGLLGLAVAPDFAQTGVFYLNYNAANPRRTVIARYRASGDTADRASESVILEVGQPFTNHKGGQTLFGPDGYLYIGFGDGGGARDPMGNGQNLSVLLGKLLRIDVSGTSNGRNYRIPPDNPFVGRGGGVREEIWAYGLRNPWRFSWDRQTGTLWLGDVGQNALEEVDVITKGGNYGWNIMEGGQCLTGGTCDHTGLVPPITDYATAPPNCSVTGGFVYRGQAIESLRGAYVYSDYCGGALIGLRYDGSRATAQSSLVGGSFLVSSFAQSQDGELYVLSYGGSGGIFKLVP